MNHAGRSCLEAILTIVWPAFLALGLPSVVCRSSYGLLLPVVAPILAQLPGCSIPVTGT
jgi:hypothetical protein